MSSVLYVNRNSSEASGTRSSPHYFEMGWGMSFCCFQLSMDIDIKQEDTCTVWSHSSAQQWLTFSHTGSMLTRMFQLWHYNTCISTKMYFWKETEVKYKWWWGSTQDVKYLDCSKDEVCTWCWTCISQLAQSSKHDFFSYHLGRRYPGWNRGDYSWWQTPTPLLEIWWPFEYRELLVIKG